MELNDISQFLNSIKDLPKSNYNQKKSEFLIEYANLQKNIVVYKNLLELETELFALLLIPLLTLFLLVPEKLLRSISPNLASYFTQFIRAILSRLLKLYRKNKPLSTILLKMCLLPVRILLMPLVLPYSILAMR